MKKNLVRSLVVLTIVSACLALASAPVSAAPIHHAATITGGTITLAEPAGGGGTTLTLPLAGTTGTGCGSTIGLIEDAGTILIKPFSSTSRFTVGGTHYVAKITRVSSGIANFGSSGGNDHITTTVSNLSLRIDIYLPTNTSSTATDCAESALQCRLFVTHAVGLDWGGSTPLAASRNVNLATVAAGLTRGVPQAACPNATFLVFAGGTHTIANPGIQVTGVFPVNDLVGEITLAKTGIYPETLDLDPAAASCTDAGFTWTTSSTTSSSTFSVTALSSSHVTSFDNGGSYLVILTRSTAGNVAGHISSTTTPHSVTGLRIGIVMTVYNTTSCTPTGTPVCNLATVLALSGTMTGIGTSNSFSFTGSTVGTVAAFPTCTAGPSFLVGAAGTVTSPVAGHLP